MVSKKLSAILLPILTVIGSIIVFYTYNLLLSDLSNMFYGTHDANIISSIPGFMFSLDLVLATIFVYRAARKPEYSRRMLRSYTFILMGFSLIGIITSILTGSMIYHSFTAPYPFAGYTIISLIVHILLFLGSIYVEYLSFTKIKIEPEKRKLSIGYVLFTVAFCVLVWFAMNRFGALLYSPWYIHWRTFYISWPFYLSLLLPIALLAHNVMYMYDFYKKSSGVALIVCSAIFGLTVLLGGITIATGLNNPTFVSDISPAMGLGRLATKPYDIIFHLGVMLLLNIYSLYHSIVYFRKHRVKVENTAK